MTRELEFMEQVGAGHAAALRWFAEHEGVTGPRPWGSHRPSDFRADVRLVAQRGIHVPTGWECALSVTVKRDSSYGDGKPISEEDGTWLLPYAAHAGADGTGLESRWNRGLLECMRSRIPVGVLLEVGAATYRNLGLAFVEEYDPNAGYFLLHGSVRIGDLDDRWVVDESDLHDQLQCILEEASLPERVKRSLVFARQREEQARFRATLRDAYGNRCAVTGYDVEQALQAAHILNYSGRSSQRPQNGILLRADVHLLFDNHLLTIEPSRMVVELAPQVSESRYASYAGRAVSVPTDRRVHPSREKLRVHWEVCRRAWG